MKFLNTLELVKLSFSSKSVFILYTELFSIGTIKAEVTAKDKKLMKIISGLIIKHFFNST